MAYPEVGGPYGFLPVNLLGGQVYAGSTRQLPIASGYAKNIGFGDFVTIISDGSINRVDPSTGAKSTFAAKPVGIFLGCSYTDPNLGYKIFKQMWPTGTAASDAMAVIADDPDIIMKAAVGNNSAVVVTSSGMAKADVGNNIGYFVKANATGWVGGVNTATGDAACLADLNTMANTVSLPLRIIDVVKETQLSDGSYCECLVKFNEPYIALSQATTSPFTVTATSTGGHQYRNPVGI